MCINHTLIWLNVGSFQINVGSRQNSKLQAQHLKQVKVRVFYCFIRCYCWQEERKRLQKEKERCFLEAKDMTKFRVFQKNITRARPMSTEWKLLVQMEGRSYSGYKYLQSRFLPLSWLSDSKLLERCVRGKTQSNNECVGSMS